MTKEAGVTIDDVRRVAELANLELTPRGRTANAAGPECHSWAYRSVE